MLNENNLVHYTYSVYGLKIISEIPLPELVTVDKIECQYPEVYISYGTAPKEIEGAIIKGEYVKLSRKEFYLYIKGVAHYYVEGRNKIIVEPEVQNNLEQIKLFLLGTCLGMLLNQRNTIAIHGGAVALNGQGIIITGHTGAGKSTLTSVLRKEGFAFLADDVSALDFDFKGNCIIYPTYPQQKLCRDAMEKMGYDVDRFIVIDAIRDKYALPLERNFLSFPAALNSIYEINIGESNNVEIAELHGNEKIQTILRNIYRIELIRHIGLEPQYFKQCVEIAKTVQVYRITRPREGFTVNNQVRLIRNALEGVGRSGR